MSSQPNWHIAIENHDDALVVEITSRSISDPTAATELGHQLVSLIRPGGVNHFVLDFQNVKSMSSTAFGALMSFILKVREQGGAVKICNMDEFVRFGADIVRVGDYAQFHDDVQTALEDLRNPFRPTP
jgi:anti-anti-sigma factor